LDDETKLNQEYLIKFYIEDFKTTSDKLESTDKKCQFIIQIYGSVVTILLSLMSILWDKSQLKHHELEICIIFALLIIVGQFIHRYILIGNSIHTIYLNRMNQLRRLILDTCKLNDKTKQNYGFLSQVPASSKGMGYTMQNMLQCVLIYMQITLLLEILSRDLSIIRGLISFGIIIISILFFRDNRKHYATNCNSAEKISNSFFINNDIK